MNYVRVSPEETLQRLLSIESLGDAMDAILEMGPMSIADFSKYNNALMWKHFPERFVDGRAFYECVYREIKFSGPEETLMVVCSECLKDTGVFENDAVEREFVIVDKNPLPFEAGVLECEVCGE